MYSFDQVILELDNAIALKTLKNWANRIEKMTDTRFERRYAKNMSDENKATHINKQESEDLKRDMRQLLKVSQSILAENASLKERIGALERGTAE